jgi:predicted lipid-binding transport protein (Tim44 family)
MEPTQTPMQPQNKSGVGSIIGTIVILAIIILGGLYFWGKRVEETKTVQTLTTDTTQPAVEPNEAAVIMSMSSSDDLDAIQADIASTKTTGLSTELDQPSAQ